MKPLMYRHCPCYPALWAAVFVLALGVAVAGWLQNRVESGIGEPSSVIAASCATFGVAATLLVAAFARYQFTHLWKKPGRSSSQKGRQAR